MGLGNPERAGLDPQVDVLPCGHHMGRDSRAQLFSLLEVALGTKYNAQAKDTEATAHSEWKSVLCRSRGVLVSFGACHAEAGHVGGTEAGSPTPRLFFLHTHQAWAQLQVILCSGGSLRTSLVLHNGPMHPAQENKVFLALGPCQPLGQAPLGIVMFDRRNPLPSMTQSVLHCWFI